MMALGLSSNKGHRLSPAIVHSKYQIWTNYEGLGMFALVCTRSRDVNFSARDGNRIFH